MKKLLIGVILISGLAVAQQPTNRFEYEEEYKAVDLPPDNPVDPDPAPVNEYIPFLAAAGLGLAVYFGRKKTAKA